METLKHIFLVLIIVGGLWIVTHPRPLLTTPPSCSPMPGPGATPCKFFTPSSDSVNRSISK